MYKRMGQLVLGQKRNSGPFVYLGCVDLVPDDLVMLEPEVDWLDHVLHTLREDTQLLFEVLTIQLTRLDGSYNPLTFGVFICCRYTR